MKGKGSGGFSLIETLIAIVILGMVVVPTCTALVMSIRINDKTDRLLQAQLAVSSAVETLMAEGYSEGEDYNERFPDVTISLDEDNSSYVGEGEEKKGVYFTITVSDATETDISVTTTVRAAKAEEGGTS